MPGVVETKMIAGMINQIAIQTPLKVVDGIAIILLHRSYIQGE